VIPVDSQGEVGSARPQEEDPTPAARVYGAIPFEGLERAFKCVGLSRWRGIPLALYLGQELAFL
jgi:hypothetical protein